MSRRTVLPGPWAALADAFGGVAALAAALGVAPVTLWRWGRGAAVPGPAALAVAALARKMRVASPLSPRKRP
jgi:hypothetical protein